MCQYLIIKLFLFIVELTKCSAQIQSTSLLQVPHELVLREVKLYHNHEVSKGVKASYPESRRLTPSFREEAINMLALGVNVENL